MIVKDNDHLAKAAFSAAIHHESVDNRDRDGIFHWDALPKPSQDYWRKIAMGVARAINTQQVRR